MKLQDALKSLREKAGVSQQELASRAGLSWSLVAQIEQGKKLDLRVSTLLRLAEVLGIEPAELLRVFAEGGIAERAREKIGRKADAAEAEVKKKGASRRRRSRD